MSRLTSSLSDGPALGLPPRSRPDADSRSQPRDPGKFSSSRNGKLAVCDLGLDNSCGQELIPIPTGPLSQTLTELQVKELCLKAREILVEEANIQWIDSPVTVSSTRLCVDPFGVDVWLTFPPCRAPRSAETFTDNSGTCSNSSKLGDSAQIRITYSSVSTPYPARTPCLSCPR